MIPENVKKLLKRWKLIYFATSSKEGIPNLIAAESCGLMNEKIAIADCHFNKTLSNLKENSNVAVIASGKKEWYQIKGTSEYLTSGKDFDKAAKMLEGTDFKAKGLVLISIKEIYDLNSCKKIL